jgi:mono/diheme cytochrome c family protein
MRTNILTGLTAAILASTIAWSQQPQEQVDSIQGAVLYKAYCAVCHGVDARGNGPMAASLRVSPPDLTRYAARRGGTVFRAEMRRTILGPRDGVAHGTSEMPIWGPTFSEVGLGDRDMGQVRADNLVRYLESLQRN